MKSKKIIIPIVIVLVAIICFVIYKGIMLSKYNAEKVELIKDNIFNSVIKISKDESTIMNTFEVDNISFRNDFDKYEKKGSFYVLYDENKKIISALGEIGSSTQCINLLSTAVFELHSVEKNNEEDFETGKDMVDFLAKNNIKNDIDLLKYIKKNYYLKNSIFTKVSKMKENNIINLFVLTTLSQFESITLINGDFQGYIVNSRNENTREIHILKDNKQYTIVLLGSEITTDEYIQSLIGTLKIN